MPQVLRLLRNSGWSLLIISRILEKNNNGHRRQGYFPLQFLMSNHFSSSRRSRSAEQEFLSFTAQFSVLAYPHNFSPQSVRIDGVILTLLCSAIRYLGGEIHCFNMIFRWTYSLRRAKRCHRFLGAHSCPWRRILS